MNVAADKADNLHKKSLAFMRKRQKETTEKKPIGSVDMSKKWVRLSVAVDSGACESVMDPEQVPNCKLEETEDSKNEEDFQSATGEPIPNLGALQFPRITRESTLRGMQFGGAPVSKPLASVKRICSAGHTVVFMSLIHLLRCRRRVRCISRWSPYN